MLAPLSVGPACRAATSLVWSRSEQHVRREPVVLTVNGKAQVVVQDAAAYQKLLDAAAKTEREETVAAIREGLADVKAGRTKPARAALKALAKKYGIATPDK